MPFIIRSDTLYIQGPAPEDRLRIDLLPIGSQTATHLYLAAPAKTLVIDWDLYLPPDVVRAVQTRLMKKLGQLSQDTERATTAFMRYSASRPAELADRLIEEALGKLPALPPSAYTMQVGDPFIITFQGLLEGGRWEGEVIGMTPTSWSQAMTTETADLVSGRLNTELREAMG